MAHGANDTQRELERNPEAIRAGMEATRSALTEKLETLEGRVMETVETVQSKVGETVQTVKDTVQDTIQTVKQTFDIRYQVSQHPWLMVGAAVASGFALGHLMAAGTSVKPRARLGTVRPAGAAGRTNGARGDGATLATRWSESSAPRTPTSVSPQPQSKGLLAGFTDQFGDELRLLQQTAIGAVMGIVRDWVKDTIPRVAPQIEQMLDGATRKLGGEPISGPVLNSTRP